MILHSSIHSRLNRFNIWQSLTAVYASPGLYDQRLKDVTIHCMLRPACKNSVLFHYRVLSDFLQWISVMILSNIIISMSIYFSFYFPCGFVGNVDIEICTFKFVWVNVTFLYLRSYPTVHACSSGTLTKLLHTGMPNRRHRTWHLIPSQYTDMGPTCHWAIHWCGMLTRISNYQFKCRGSDQIRKIFPGLQHTPVSKKRILLHLI